MAKYSKFNIIYLLQKWMDSVAGQTFMNYAYSWGASIVILGTLFKLTHLPGANIMLFIGMGTEVFVFFISAFDRPFDKTSDGMNLASDKELADQIAKDTTDDFVDESADESVNEENADETSKQEENINAQPQGTPVIIGGGVIGGGVIGGGVIGGGVISGQSAEQGASQVVSPSIAPQGAALAEAPQGIAATASDLAAEGTAIAQGVQNAPVVIGGTIGAPAPAVSKETAEAMEEATTTYVDRLNELNELLLKVGAQSERITTDSEEMENLNRTLTGIARVYEMLLKNASQQMMTQDEINVQTQKLAQQIADLNSIYSRMIEAMTVNMPGAAPLKN